MKTLNRENYNELMFELLENEIQGEERIQLLNQINSDPFFKTQWEFWQQSMVQESELSNVPGTDEFLESLIVKPVKNRIFISRRWFAAASILLLCSLAVILQQNSSSTENGTSEVDKSAQILAGKTRDKHGDTLNTAANTEATVSGMSDAVRNQPSRILKYKKSYVVPGREEQGLIPPRHKSDSSPARQEKIEELPEQSLIAVRSDSAVQNPLSIVSIESGKAPAKEKTKITAAALLTNTKIRFRKVKDKPAITVQGEEATLIISLQQ